MRFRLTWDVGAGVLILAAGFLLFAGGSSASTAIAKPAVVPVNVPAQGGITFAAVRLYAKPGVRIPARPKLHILNARHLPATLVAVAHITPLTGKRPGVEIFMAAVNKRTTVKTRSLSARDDGYPYTDRDIVAELGDYASGSGFYSTDMSVQMTISPEELKLIAEAVRYQELEKDIKKQKLRAIEISKMTGHYPYDPRLGQILFGQMHEDMLPDLIKAVDDFAAERLNPDDLDKIIKDIENKLDNDLDGNGTIGGKKQPSVYSYSIPDFTVSFTGPSANLSPTVTDEFNPTPGCGDPATGSWPIPTTTTGLPIPPTHNVANFSRQNPYLLYTHKFDQSGTPTGEVQIRLHYQPGPPPTIAVEITTTGDITQVTAPAVPLQVALTKVASC